MQDFAELLRHYRRERGMSLRAFETQVGMSQANLSRLEHGQVGPPSRETIERLEQALDIPSGQLVRAAGLAIDAHAPTDIESAIAQDGLLSPSEKATLLGMLKVMREPKALPEVSRKTAKS